MPEKEPQVTFTDRRKISSDGEIRPGVAQSEAEEQKIRQAERPQPPAAAEKTADSGIAGSTAHADASESHSDEDAPDEPLPDGPTAQESAESNAAYHQTTQQLDDLLRAKAPDSSHLGPSCFRPSGAVDVYDRHDEYGRRNTARGEAAHRLNGRASNH